MPGGVVSTSVLFSGRPAAASAAFSAASALAPVTAAARAPSRAAWITSTWSRTSTPTWTSRSISSAMHREDEGQLDCGLTLVTPARSHEMFFLIEENTASRRSPTLPAPPPDVAQIPMSSAIAAAPSRTSAYSAVA